MNYQLAKFQVCRLSLASFIGRFRKTQWWRHHDAISCCWDLKISDFLKLDIDYHLSKFQIFCLSGSNFMEVSVRYQILPMFLVMTSLWRHLLLLSFQICIFCRTYISYQPSKFQLSRLSASNFTEGVENTPQVLLGLNNRIAGPYLAPQWQLVLCTSL